MKVKIEFDVGEDYISKIADECDYSVEEVKDKLNSLSEDFSKNYKVLFCDLNLFDE